MKYLAALVCVGILSGQAASPAGETLWVTANEWRLKTQVYRSVRSSGRPVLVVVLHGDLLGVRAVPRATYHYEFARAAAAKIDDLVIAALLRPGYRDHTGERSAGQQGLTTGDNYTPEVVDAADPVAPPELSERYAQALRARGGDVTIEIVPRVEHDILNEPATLDAFTNFVARVREK